MSGPPPPGPVPAHPGTTPPARRPAGLIALCAVLAVLLVAAVATIAVLLAIDDDGSSGGGGGGDDRSAADYASDACERAEGLPEEVADDDLAIDEPLLWELQSVAAMAIAAGHADDEYSDHLDAGMDIFSGASRLDVEMLTDGLDDLREACEESPG